MAKGKTIMRAFKIDEISAVDSPAQKGARAVLMKRGETLVDDDLPEGGSGLPVIKTKPKETTMDPKEIEKMKKDLADMTTAKAAADAELEKSKKLADMSDAEKAKYNAMNDTQKSEFLAKSKEERLAIIKNDADANPVVYKNAAGDEFRKNDDPRLVAMAKKSDEDGKIAKAATEKFEKAELEKRAADLFKNSPGTAEEKGAMLKALEAIPDEALRKKALEHAKAGDNALSAAFTRKGAGGGTSNTDTTALDKLEELAKAKAATDKIPYAKAYTAVLDTPEGKELYQESLQK